MVANSDNPQTLSKFNFQKELLKSFPIQNNSTKSGAENDAASIFSEEKEILISSNLFIENVHFDLTYFPLKHLGYKIVAVSITSILAMNGTPTQLRINLAVSSRFSKEAIEELLLGVKLCCERYTIDLVGLDISTTVTGSVISTTIVGEIPTQSKVLQSGANESELICVSGDLASAYTGFILLEREAKVFAADPSQQPDFIGVDYLLERYLKPEPPLAIINKLKEFEVLPTSMIMLKDGLANGLLHLCNASKLGCTIFEEKLPVDSITFEKLKSLNIVGTTIALNGGEDYELLFTIKQDDYEKIKTYPDVSVIGFMTAESAGKNLVTNDNQQFELRAQGWDDIS